MLAAGLFREMLICYAGDITPVDVAIQSGGADCPFPGSFLLVYNNVDGNTIHDLLGNICGETVVVAQFYFRAFGGSVEISVVLGDLRRITEWAAGGLCSKMWVQTTLDLPIDGGGRETKNMRNLRTATATVIELFNEKSVIPV